MASHTTTKIEAIRPAQYRVEFVRNERGYVSIAHWYGSKCECEAVVIAAASGELPVLLWKLIERPRYAAFESAMWFGDEVPTREYIA